MERKTESELRAHAIREYPRESCGIIAVVKGRERYFPCTNKAVGGEHFILSGEDYARVDDLGEITAIVHSHPDVPAVASEADKVSCEASEILWLIVGTSKDNDQVVSGDIFTLNPCGYRAPLVGREFSHGVLDCYQLIVDWFDRERGITLPQFERHDDWWNDGHSDLYTEGFENAGFVDKGQDIQPQIGDVILMQVRSNNCVPNHAGVYIGDELILHHLYGRLSSRDIYGGYLRENTRKIVRHKDLM